MSPTSHDFFVLCPKQKHFAEGAKKRQLQISATMSPLTNRYPGDSLAGLCVLITWLLTNHLILLEGSEIVETIAYKDAQGKEVLEYAFRAPMKGYPQHVIRMYCANVKLRLYWNVFREEVGNRLQSRKGDSLRRMARMARHIYEDVRAVDKPFNATKLSILDTYFGVEEDENLEPTSDTGPDNQAEGEEPKGDGENESEPDNILTSNDNSVVSKGKTSRVKSVLKKYAPKVGITIYTRWRTLWWLMMPCLFTKYYLWDPALDEFIKLKRNLVMYPDFQLVRLKDIDCLPIKLFKSLLSVCKLLNPLMNLNFGQLSLDRMNRFTDTML